MKFRPCIDIHNGKVKQIVGGSIQENKEGPRENFVSEQDAAFYANYYKKNNIKGGHVILLNGQESPYYKETKNQAINALLEYPGGLQVGGGITDQNAEEFLSAGASHIIVTSFVFLDGKINYDNLDKLIHKVGKKNIVIDLSCRKKNGRYYIVTDRWQKYTEEELNEKTLEELSQFCDEFLIHAVDVEGMAKGIEEGVASILGQWAKIPITYAGGVHNFDDLEKLKMLGENKVDVTIGSALSLFGGQMEMKEVMQFIAL